MSDTEGSVSVGESVTNNVNGKEESSPTLNSKEESELEITQLKKTPETVTLNTTTSEDSEYETLEEDNGQSSRSSGSRRTSFSDDLSDIAIEAEREDGDGQEENALAKDKKLDDDEDRRNPQYIPKKGTFYEHDDRTMADENEGEESKEDDNRREKSEEGEKDPKLAGTKKGKVWTEKADVWRHDLYNEDEQKPKSTQELIDTYGYDIRNEEAPPKARRRRRYGRGPNKYTRNWEDEDAYTRSIQAHRKVYHNNKEEFPDLADAGSGRKKRDSKIRGRSKSPSMVQPTSPVQTPQQNVERDRGFRRETRVQKEEKPLELDQPKTSGNREPVTMPNSATDRLPTSNNFPPPPMVVGLSNRSDKAEKLVDTPRVGRGRGFRGTGKPRPTMEFTASRGRVSLSPIEASLSKETSPQVQDSLKHAADMLIQDFSHVYINNNNNTNNIVEETIIPRSERRSQNRSHHGGGGEPHSGGDGNAAGGRSKRYSTQRQRSLPENTPTPTYSPPHNIPYYTQPPPNSYVQPAVYNDVAPPQVTSPPMQMVAFLPPGPPPTATAAPPYPPPPLLNYIPPPTFPPMALQPPAIPGQFDDISQSAELYQGQGGITYYSTQSQTAVPRPNPPRRVKLAIPIVPPPDKSSSGKRSSGSGNSSKQEMQSVSS